MYPIYFGAISLNVEDASPGSTVPNGIELRDPSIKSFQFTGEELGYIPAPITFSEAFRRFKLAWLLAQSGLLLKDTKALSAISSKARCKIWPVVLQDVDVEWGLVILDEVAAASN